MASVSIVESPACVATVVFVSMLALWTWDALQGQAKLFSDFGWDGLAVLPVVDGDRSRLIGWEGVESRHQANFPVLGSRRWFFQFVLWYECRKLA